MLLLDALLLSACSTVSSRINEKGSVFYSLDADTRAKIEHGDIALMITDHSMPAMTGAELVHQATALRPDLKVLLASGYDKLPDAPDLKVDRLPKPYFEADLIAAIARVTEGGR